MAADTASLHRIYNAQFDRGRRPRSARRDFLLLWWRTCNEIDEIKLLVDYNDWADARILAACAKVTPEQYAAPGSYGRGGLRAIMVHKLDNIWQQRITLQGFYREPLADEAAYDATELHEEHLPTFAALCSPTYVTLKK